MEILCFLCHHQERKMPEKGERSCRNQSLELFYGGGKLLLLDSNIPLSGFVALTNYSCTVFPEGICDL